MNNVVRRLQRHHPRVGLIHYYSLTAPRHALHEESFCAFGHKRAPAAAPWPGLGGGL